MNFNPKLLPWQRPPETIYSSECSSSRTFYINHIQIEKDRLPFTLVSLFLNPIGVIILGSRAFVSFIDTSTLPCISIALLFVNEVRNLGVMMSSNLSRQSYVLSISKRVHFSLHRLKYHRNFMSRELRSTLVTSVIFHILDYCCLVYNDLTNKSNTKFQQLINYTLRKKSVKNYRRVLDKNYCAAL